MNKKAISADEEFSSDVEHIVGAVARHFRGKPVTPEAVLYPNAKDVLHRFQAMISAIDWRRYDTDRRLRLLDVGCGPGFLLDYLDQIGLLDRVSYVGTDLNREIVEVAAKRWPNHTFHVCDIRQQPFGPGEFDVAILCGIFTARFTLGEQAMRRLMMETLTATWPSVDQYLAFNVMSKHVDWERDDLFHLPTDDAIGLARNTLGARNVRILHDYGLYEYTCVIFRAPIVSAEPIPPAWLGTEKS